MHLDTHLSISMKTYRNPLIISVQHAEKGHSGSASKIKLNKYNSRKDQIRNINQKHILYRRSEELLALRTSHHLLTTTAAAMATVMPAMPPAPETAKMALELHWGLGMGSHLIPLPLKTNQSAYLIEGLSAGWKEIFFISNIF